MILSDVIYNDDFDINCNFSVYSGIWNDGGNLLWSTVKDGYEKPKDELLDRKIKYLTVNNNVLIIEVA